MDMVIVEAIFSVGIRLVCGESRYRVLFVSSWIVD